MNQIEKNARLVLRKLVVWRGETFDVDGQTLVSATQLTAEDVNDTVSYLGEIGAVEVMGGIGTDPFDFADVKITSKGRRTYLDWSASAEASQIPERPQAPGAPRHPIGSPFGFKPDDWEFVTKRQDDRSRLYVVMGFQFKSEYYDSDRLLANVRAHLEAALKDYNESGLGPQVHLDFGGLKAGYGEHLFNHIVRCVIGADIAIFDTSDYNPNVMIELGVALTWGVSVLPIRAETAPALPSDISGQTWIKHRDSGDHFLDPDFDKRLAEMIGRAVVGKSRHEDVGQSQPMQQGASVPDESREALQVYKRNFGAFLRHLEADWKSERASEPTNVDDAKAILETARQGVLRFRAQIARADDPTLPDLLDEAARRLKLLVKHELYIDGGKSWRAFWTDAEAALDLLRRVPLELERVLTGGVPVIAPPSPDAASPSP